MRAMILAAGLGTRLRPLTYVMPKPVAPVLNRPIIVWIAELLARHGFSEVVTNLSYMPERIRGYCAATGQEVPQEPGAVVRCIFESLALKYRQTIGLLEGATGSSPPARQPGTAGMPPVASG